MYEVTMQELGIFTALGFCCGIFASVFLARFFEVVHTWRMVRETILWLLYMCSKLVEDVAFLQQVKKDHMRRADFTTEQIQSFEEVDERYLTNWKDSVILSLVKRAPPHFKSLLPFADWREAMQYMKEEFKHD
tara:strand:+ start:225 stop:623 length:399 start_codon:yes stop_codon:yes gene_type:complete